VRRLIRAGAKLFFLPRYSPDLNPIEQVFAKLKTLLRKTDPRTIETTWRGIGDRIRLLGPVIWRAGGEGRLPSRQARCRSAPTRQAPAPVFASRFCQAG
jgi:transposase